MENKRRGKEEDEAAEEEEEEAAADSFPFAHLPPELVLNAVLAWLPLRSLFRFKTVCKLWNSTISSPTKFAHLPSHLPRQSDSPWLIFFTPKNFRFILAFDFQEDAWFKFDVEFLSSSSSSSSSEKGFLWCIGSARGWLLVKLDSTLHVCNPITKSLFPLPPFRCIKLLMTQGFYTDFTPMSENGMRRCHGGDDSNRRMKCDRNGEDEGNPCAKTKECEKPDGKQHAHMKIDGEIVAKSSRAGIAKLGFKVVVIGNDKSQLVVEAYDARKHSWISVGSLPSSFVIKHDEMVECNGLFYSLLLSPKAMLVIGGSFGRGDGEGEAERGGDGGLMHWRIQALPDTHDGNPRLLSCRSTLFMVCYNLSYQDSEFILIWRFEPCHGAWIKMDPMPEQVSWHMKSISLSNCFDCVGVGKFICIRALSTQKVLTFNVCDSTWRWLPDLPYSLDTILIRGFQFEPRLDYGLIA